MSKFACLLLCFVLLGCDKDSGKTDTFFSGDVVEKPMFDAKEVTVSFKAANMVRYADHDRTAYSDAPIDLLGRIPADHHKLLLFFTDSPVGAHYIPILADTMHVKGDIVTVSPNKKQNILSFLELALLSHRDPVPYFTVKAFDSKASKLEESFVITAPGAMATHDEKIPGLLVLTLDPSTMIDQVSYDIQQGNDIFDISLPIDKFTDFWMGKGSFKSKFPIGNIFFVEPDSGKKILFTVRIEHAMVFEGKLVLACALLHDTSVHGKNVLSDMVKNWNDKELKRVVLFVDSQ